MSKPKRTTKQAGDSKSKRRPMPSDPVELARAMFRQADEKIQRKQ